MFSGAEVKEFLRVVGIKKVPTTDYAVYQVPENVCVFGKSPLQFLEEFYKNDYQKFRSSEPLSAKKRSSRNNGIKENAGAGVEKPHYKQNKTQRLEDFRECNFLDFND